jgi:hypothetical protein
MPSVIAAFIHGCAADGVVAQGRAGAMIRGPNRYSSTVIPLAFAMMIHYPAMSTREISRSPTLNYSTVCALWRGRSCRRDRLRGRFRSQSYFVKQNESTIRAAARDHPLVAYQLLPGSRFAQSTSCHGIWSCGLQADASRTADLSLFFTMVGLTFVFESWHTSSVARREG